jgi:hypothetical protein
MRVYEGGWKGLERRKNEGVVAGEHVKHTRHPAPGTSVVI